MASGDIQKTPFIKQLAASDRPTRDKAVASLKTYLTASRTFTKTDLLKLWKGLFYCFWLSDRPRPQQALANDLAELLSPMNEANSVTFYRAFWETITREWSGIDVLRIDKFLLLVRRYLAVGFRYCKAMKWREDMVENLLLKTLEKTALDPGNQKMPNGVRFQLADIWLDELEKVVGEDRVSAVTTTLLMRPWEAIATRGMQKLWRKKAREVLADERLREWGYEGEFAAKDPTKKGEEEEWGGFKD
ncbi:hypothetical protein BDD12DRAFT_915508 [Trichophaea hybrida]|nr:hypothetical protein BDD12DRAFT_915508 [Trichophaea hybrida]